MRIDAGPHQSLDLNTVAADLNKRNWKGVLSTTDDFIVYLYQFGNNAGAVEYTNRLTAEISTAAAGATKARRG